MSKIFKTTIHTLSPNIKIDPLMFKLAHGFKYEESIGNLTFLIYESLSQKNKPIAVDHIIKELSSIITNPTDKTVFDQLVKTWNTNKHTISSPTQWKPTTESPIDAMRKLKDLFQ